MKRDRSWRRSQDKRVIDNRLNELKSLDPKYAEKMKKSPNKLSKKHPLDCGKSGCKLCHPNKNYHNGNTKDYEYYRNHPEEVDHYILDPEYDENYGYDE